MKLRYLIIPLAIILYGWWTYSAFWVGLPIYLVSWVGVHFVVSVNAVLYCAFAFGDKAIKYLRKLW